MEFIKKRELTSEEKELLQNVSNSMHDEILYIDKYLSCNKIYDEDIIMYKKIYNIINGIENE